MAVAGFVAGQLLKPDAASSVPTITQIQKLGDLVVLRVSVADVAKNEDSGYKGILIARGDALIAVDLQAAKLKSANQETKKLVVLLPAPRVLQPRVDHERSFEYRFDRDMKFWTTDFWTADKSESATQAWRKAQRAVEQACSEKAFIDQAREQTELILTNMYGMVGWKIDIVWQDGWKASKVAE